MDLSIKARRIEQSVTLEITAKAKELRESGVDVISFAAGEPDFNTPQNILDAAKKAMDNGNTKYTATSGIIELRKAICKKLKEDNNLSYNENQIVVSTGAKQSLANSFMAILNPGDEVIVPIPYWVSYPELIKLADGNPVFVNTGEENDYKYNVEALEKVVTEKTKAIILNNPNNPTGTIYSKDELISLSEFAKKYNLIIIADEIYEKLIYDGKEHISIASLNEDAYNRTIVINGLSKTYAMTGWRGGYTASSVQIAKIMSNIQSHMTSNTCSITQYAALEALTGPQQEIKNMISEFEIRRNYMYKELEEIEDINIIKPQGAFYVMVNIENTIGKKVKNEVINSSMDFAKLLLENENVAVIPGKAFGLDNYIRLSYATSIEAIEKGIKRLKKFISKLK